MAFDSATRNTLAKMVAGARNLLAKEFTEQLQEIYGIQPDGTIIEMEKLAHLNDEELAVASMLRDRVAHLENNMATEKKPVVSAIKRMTREQAFTLLNRFAALRMCEERNLIQESIANGIHSKGFKVYLQIAGSGIGDTFARYKTYLLCLFDEIAIDLGAVFDRFSPYGLLFPREDSLLELLGIVNDKALKHFWVEDETIGWIYQYYNDPEERKQMRKESAAPRNSRELAVRNQFFTPRFVVEFLTDNTLGRIWYEMTEGETRLADQCRYLVRRPTEIFLPEGEVAPKTPDQEGLSQEELLKQPVYIPHRQLKDPREIRLLDPACGSMHFGLYAFDLFETIYEEAWDNGFCPALQEAYTSKDEFLKDVPRLIIEHNIHGIDIDPRAVQIAGLSLWLRAQKAWQAQRIKPVDRPRVRRSNIVCAEPMPGSSEMLVDFVATLEPPQLGELVKTVFDKMQLAGEAGSLLKIEEEIRAAIDTARQAWEKIESTPLQLSLTEEFNQASKAPVLADLEKALAVSRRTLSSDFWDTAEQQVIDSLRVYAEQADADSYQRRLFADDAARGFAFIDLCRKRYDAVVMNPPYGDISAATLAYTKQTYSEFSHNIYSCFWKRSDELVYHGKIGALTSRTFLTLSQFEHVRSFLLQSNVQLDLVADLGAGILDGAAVDTSASIVTQSRVPLSLNTLFFRLDSLGEGREAALLREIESLENLQGTDTYALNVHTICALPQKRVFYWAPRRILNLFKELRCFDPTIADVRPGLLTGADFRFLRLWWELPGRITAWHTLAKGGDYERFFGDLPFLLNWVDGGAEVRQYALETVGSVSKWIFNEDFYFRPGSTFPNSSALGFSARVLPANSIISVKGQGVFPKHSGTKLYILGLLNTPLAHALLFLFNPGKDVQAGDVKRLPFANLKSKSGDVDSHVLQIISDLRFLHSFDETSSCFLAGSSLFGNSDKIRCGRSQSITENENLVAEKIYTDLAVTSNDVAVLCSRVRPRPSVDEQIEHSLGHICGAFAESNILLLYVLGTAFGRWDIRYATGESQPPELPDPFDPLPVCPPGMLQDAAGLPADPEDVPADYPLRISWPGILVDDENHPEDIVARVREAIEVIWKDRAEAIEQEACEILGVKTLRDYFRRPAAFFADHLKRYSKSRRQAPIYWPLSTKSGGYTLWLYYHRLTDQTLFSCVTDFVKPRIQEVEKDIERVRVEVNAQGSTQNRQNLENLLDFEQELKNFHDELLRAADLPYKPNLNDGVMINAAPLSIFFLHRKWNKDLQGCWKKLEKGEYDWAHMAYNIWPERVIPKCHKDRSLAIAHELENEFWEKSENGTDRQGNQKFKWVPKKLSREDVQRIIREKTGR